MPGVNRNIVPVTGYDLADKLPQNTVAKLPQVAGFLPKMSIKTALGFRRRRSQAMRQQGEPWRPG
jgi:hypothetical protein